jgi:hypothetical protein
MNPQSLLPKLLDLLLAVALACGMTGAVEVRAQNAMRAPIKGVQHRIDVSIAFDTASIYASPEFRDTARATITALVRISAHARESNFFGMVLATVSDVSPGEQRPGQQVWQETVCHQDRGLPKFAVIAVNGLIDRPQGQIVIAARPRHIGRVMPADEIVPHQALLSGSDGGGKFREEQIMTHASRIRVNVKLYSTSCDLLASTGEIIPAQ